MKKNVLPAFVLAVFLAAILASAFACAGNAANADPGIKVPLKAGEKAKDPVCGMDITVTDKTEHAEHQGLHYYFCSSECKQNFEKNPDKYLKK